MDARSKQYWDLKHDISVTILKYIANELNMTFDEYASVYDSEAHERMLNEIMKTVSESQL